VEPVDYSIKHRRSRPLSVSAVLFLLGVVLCLGGIWVRAVGLMLMVDPQLEPWIGISALCGACVFWLWGLVLATGVAIREDGSYSRYTTAIVLALGNGLCGVPLTIWMISRVIARPSLQNF
jgi:hypothetical protein